MIPLNRAKARVIYFCRSQVGQILLLEIYAKNEKEDLSPDEIKKLKSKVKP